MSESMRVLIVDDDWPMAKTLVDVLTIKGYQADGASSSCQAVGMMEEDDYDCVLTDIKMPEVNGVDLLRAIKAMRPHLPVVFMTAYAANRLMDEGFREGAIASFLKPLDINLLLWFLSMLSEGRSIVVADDDAQFWLTLRQGLESRGFDVLKVDDPDALLDMLKPSGQVVLVGTRLDGITGLDLLERIRAQYDVLPVVLATDEPEVASSDAERARKLNVQAWMNKPFEADELLGVLEDIRRRELGALLRRHSGALVGQFA
jgi:DNA-binding NtrC family response regulator